MEKPLIKDKTTVQPSIAIVNAYTLIATIYCASFALIFYVVVHNTFLAAVHFLAFISVVSNYVVLQRSKNFQRATNIILAIGTSVVVSLFASGGWDHTGYLWPFAYLPFAFFLTQGDETRNWVFILLVGCLITVALQYMGFIQPSYSPIALFNYFAALLVFTLCIFFYQRATVHYEQFLTYTHNLAETSLDPFIIIDTNGQISDANKISEKIMGASLEKLIGTHFFTYFTEPEKAKELCMKTLSTGNVHNFPLCVDKMKRELIINATLYTNKRNSVQKIFVIARDITEQKIMEDALRESEAQLQTIFRAAPDSVIVIDQEGKIVQWNPKSEFLFGWKSEEVIGKTLTETIIPEMYREAHIKGMKRFLKSGEGTVLNKTIELPALKKGNVEFMVELTISQTLINGKYLFIGFLRDITERKKAEEELRQSEERYHVLINEVEDYSIIRLDPTGIITNWNKGATKINGYTEEEVLGKNFSIFYTEKDQLENQPQKTLSIAEKEGQYLFSGWKVKKDESLFWADVSITRLNDNQGNLQGFVKITRDLSEQKRAEAQLMLKTEELKQSNAELEQFAYIASHDLQEPLRMVTSYLQLLQRAYQDKLDTDANDYIGFAVDGSKRMRNLINGLLEYSRIGKLEQSFENVNLNETLETVCKDLGESIKENNAIIQYKDLPVVFANKLQMQQLFQNLISNAIKFRNEKSPFIRISFTLEQDIYHFQINDNGIGIDTHYAEKVFLIFQRLHSRENYPGTGIGLAICKKIIEHHKGKIWLESTLGKGSTFHFTIRN